MSDPVYDLAEELHAHPYADDVRVSHRRIVVAHAPESRHTEKIPAPLLSHIQECIDGTVWTPEYPDGGRGAEAHSWTGGVHHDPIIPPAYQPGGRELQFSLVK